MTLLEQLREEWRRRIRDAQCNEGAELTLTEFLNALEPAITRERELVEALRDLALARHCERAGYQRERCYREDFKTCENSVCARMRALLASSSAEETK
jgi:hypothetical protein